jgi:hypothetical protein
MDQLSVYPLEIYRKNGFGHIKTLEKSIAICIDRDISVTIDVIYRLLSIGIYIYIYIYSDYCRSRISITIHRDISATIDGEISKADQYKSINMHRSVFVKIQCIDRY